MTVNTISPAEFAERRDKGEQFRLIDVRELMEFELATVEGAELLPLSEFQNWGDKLLPTEKIVVMCHHGIRSAQLCAYLMQNGFHDVWNLSGGIDAWTTEVDRTVPRY